jgi:hypothetical protein
MSDHRIALHLIIAILQVFDRDLRGQKISFIELVLLLQKPSTVFFRK